MTRKKSDKLRAGLSFQLLCERWSMKLEVLWNLQVLFQTYIQIGIFSFQQTIDIYIWERSPMDPISSEVTKIPPIHFKPLDTYSQSIILLIFGWRNVYMDLNKPDRFIRAKYFYYKKKRYSYKETPIGKECRRKWALHQQFGKQCSYTTNLIHNVANQGTTNSFPC